MNSSITTKINNNQNENTKLLKPVDLSSPASTGISDTVEISESSGPITTSDVSYMLPEGPFNVIIEFEYNTVNSLKGKKIELKHWYSDKGFNFSSGSNSNEEFDLELYDDGEKVYFKDPNINGSSGIYDAEETTLESIVKFDEKIIPKVLLPCLKNHVYCLKTFDGGFVKFIVHKVEPIKNNKSRP